MDELSGRNDRWSPIVWPTVDGRRARCRVLPPGHGDDALPRLTHPLLLLHGLAGSSDAWGPTLRRLEWHGVDQAVLAPDMPGYGRSPGPRTAMGMEELSDWCARLLDVMAIPRAHLAATSMGCQVALALARRHPDRVGAMLLAAPTTGRRLMAPWRYLVGMLNSYREPLAYKPTALRLFLQMGVRRFLGTVRKMLEDDPLAEADAVTAPCLVLRGERDAIIPEAVARQLAESLPRGAFMHVPGAAHVLQYNHPEAFTRLLLDFLAESRSP